jgi:lysophospholipase L1-like esterase
MKRLLPILSLLLAGCAGGGPTAQPPVNLSAVGDSISAGWLDPAAAGVTEVAATASFYHHDPANSFVGEAGRLAGANTVTNLGKSGSTAAQMAVEEVPNLPPATSVVILEAGTNDVLSPAPRTADFDVLMAAVRAKVPRAKLVVITVRHLARYPRTDAGVKTWDEHIRTLASSFGATVVDLESDPQWYRASEWPDSIHPNLAGAGHLGAAVAAAVLR